MNLNACEGRSLSPTVSHQGVPFLTAVRVQIDFNFLYAALRGEQYLWVTHNRGVIVMVRQWSKVLYCNKGEDATW